MPPDGLCLGQISIRSKLVDHPFNSMIAAGLISFGPYDTLWDLVAAAKWDLILFHVFYRAV